MGQSNDATMWVDYTNYFDSPVISVDLINVNKIIRIFKFKKFSAQMYNFFYKNIVGYYYLGR